jgi:hypothetical protein
MPSVPHRKLIPVLKGAGQGPVSSPNIFNAQHQCPSSLVLPSLNQSLVYYADVVLNLSRTLQGMDEVFVTLQQEYFKLGICFNKSEIVLFN